MRTNRTKNRILPLAAMVLATAVTAATPRSVRAEPLEVAVWTEAGLDGVVYPGQPVDVYFEVNRSASVLVYAVDTEGWVHLLHPSDRWDDSRVRADRTYHITAPVPDPLSDGPDGLLVIGAVAARERFPVASWLGDDRILIFCEDGTYDADAFESGDVIGRVHGDPLKAVWAIEDALVPASCRDRGFATNLCWVSVGERFNQPRYVVVGGRSTWECEPRFHIRFDLGMCLGRPGYWSHRHWDPPHSRFFDGRPRPCPVVCLQTRDRDERPVADVRWKDEAWKNTKKTWNKDAGSDVLGVGTRQTGQTRPESDSRAAVKESKKPANHDVAAKTGSHSSSGKTKSAGGAPAKSTKEKKKG